MDRWRLSSARAFGLAALLVALGCGDSGSSTTEGGSESESATTDASASTTSGGESETAVTTGGPDGSTGDATSVATSEATVGSTSEATSVATSEATVGSTSDATVGSTGDATTGEPTSCADVCDNVVVAMCAEGPPALEDCLTGCADNLAGPCGVQQQELLDCAGPDPDVTCDPVGRPWLEECAAEFIALYDCIGL